MQAVGVHDHPTLKLGLRPATPAKQRLRLRDYLLPAHPVSVNYLSGVQFGMYANDRFGVCGPTSVANSRRLITAKLKGQMQAPSQDDVFDLYRRSGNPNFNPATGQDDNGVNMQEMLQAVSSGGISGIKSLAFAAVDPANIEELKSAVALFGFVLFGVTLEAVQQQQTSQGVWDYRPSGLWGGHAILGGAYQNQPEGIEVITWAQVVRMTDAFMLHQETEAWVVIWPEHLTDAGFLQGVNLAALAADFEQMTGKKFPAVVPPTPPTPGPTPPSGPSTTTLKNVAALWGWKPHERANSADPISFYK
jgi:hypothetical protein